MKLNQPDDGTGPVEWEAVDGTLLSVQRFDVIQASVQRQAMPYLRLYSLELPVEVRRQLVAKLTERVLAAMPEQRREWTTVQFMPYSPDEFAVGGRLLSDGQPHDYFLEITAPNFTNSQIG